MAEEKETGDRHNRLVLVKREVAELREGEALCTFGMMLARFAAKTDVLYRVLYRMRVFGYWGPRACGEGEEEERSKMMLAATMTVAMDLMGDELDFHLWVLSN